MTEHLADDRCEAALLDEVVPVRLRGANFPTTPLFGRHDVYMAGQPSAALLISRRYDAEYNWSKYEPGLNIVEVP